MKKKGASLVSRVNFSLLFCGILLFGSCQAFGEESTEAQNEVWSVIENNWDKYKQGDLEAIEDSMHADALGWQNRLDTPVRKVLIMGGFSLWLKDANNRPATYELIPYAIQIFGDIANVFYTYTWKADSKLSGYGRILVSLKKQNGNWLIISSLNASCEKLPLCLD